MAVLPNEARFLTAADAALKYATERLRGAPDVVAMATDSQADFYEAAAGKRELGKDQPISHRRRE